jgi:hypothetical protein
MSKRKLTARETTEKRRRKKEFMIVFINGKQQRVRCPETVDGMGVHEFILRNADPIWLHQSELWELIDQTGSVQLEAPVDGGQQASVDDDNE